MLHRLFIVSLIIPESSITFWLQQTVQAILIPRIFKWDLRQTGYATNGCSYVHLHILACNGLVAVSFNTASHSIYLCTLPTHSYILSVLYTNEHENRESLRCGEYLREDENWQVLSYYVTTSYKIIELSFSNNY